MATTKQPVPDPAEVPVRMLKAVAVGLHTFSEGAEVEVPRAQAARWWLLGYAEPGPGVKFAPLELLAAARAALEVRENEQRASGAPPERFWARPGNARWLARLEQLTRPGGPQEAA
jgi:hypothetical protein